MFSAKMSPRDWFTPEEALSNAPQAGERPLRRHKSCRMRPRDLPALTVAELQSRLRRRESFTARGPSCLTRTDRES